MTSDKFRIRNIGFSLKIPRERKIIFSFFLLSQRCLTSLTLSGFSTSTDEFGGGAGSCSNTFPLFYKVGTSREFLQRVSEKAKMVAALALRAKGTFGVL